MSCLRLFFAGLGTLLVAPAAAQLTAVPHSGKQEIIITGERPQGSKPAHRVEMSDWWVAETPHVLVFSKGNAKEFTRITANLEKLHFLLSVLLNRVDQGDDTLKLQVTLIGDPADFDHLGLRNLRWQQGPYPKEFPNQIYYDPREDGAVMATAHADQCFALVRDAAVASGEDLVGVNVSPIAGETPAQTMGRAAGQAIARANRGTSSAGCNGNPNKVSVTAEGRLYSAFAQHYLLTYFPVAYPRWYLEGFGEIFANMDADKPGVIEYGREPERYPAVIDKFGHYPVRKVLDGTYLNDKHWFPAFSPYSAWALTHLLFFSPDWKGPLHNYLLAVAHGQSPDRAAAALGDIQKLQRTISSYRGTRISFERLTYPAYKFQPPLIRRLKQSEAVYVRGRLELGARVTIAGTDEEARQKAIAARDRWLAALRQRAAAYPTELADQQLLAEAECRSGSGANCIAVADRALALSPNDPVSLTWKGYGLALQAAQAPSTERASLVGEARATIGRANRLDTESVLPLLAYYRSYVLAGEPAPDVAVDGLVKSLDEVPSAPTTRLMLGKALVRDGDLLDARRILLPLSHGAFDPPEKPEAQQLLATLPIKPVAANDIVPH
jgi:hypothetical protein